ncbi:hypothetical protein FIBSPDRAFT_898016 [Athelia psychrophila]|uniref:F-box domain-containing protein n=1 Tax=Athelia psychrophila TaxID=1759441 RepID=A0A166BGR4_9AGAM|nr:hypothetical protein FIBSPDRAFT_898016 [Fibularhizoctonia sp. CBS 109695]
MTTMNLAEETIDDILSYLDPWPLFYVTAASQDLRRLALPHLWQTIDNENLPAQNILKRILHGFPPDAETSKARGDVPRPTAPSDLEPFQQYALRSTVFPLIQNFTADCAASCTLLRLGEFNAAKLTEFALSWEAVKHDFGRSQVPLAVSLPKLRGLTIGLDRHYPPIPFSRGVFPNDLILRVVHQIVRGTPNLRCIKLRGPVNGDVVDQIASIPGVESLDLSQTAAAGLGSMEDFRRVGDMPSLQHLVLPNNFRKWSNPASAPQIQPPLLRKLCVRDTPRLNGASIVSFQNPNITHLQVDSFLLVDPSSTVASIHTYTGLQHLHLYLHGWQWDIHVGEILERLGGLHGLTSLCFFFEDEDVASPSEGLTRTDALYIGYAWPNLISLGVSQADFEFFQLILDLPLLAELELNAYFWDDHWPSAGVEVLPAMHALRFSGSPEEWAAHGTRQVISAQCAGLESLVITSGSGPIYQRQAEYPDTSSEEEDEDVESEEVDEDVETGDEYDQEKDRCMKTRKQKKGITRRGEQAPASKSAERLSIDFAFVKASGLVSDKPGTSHPAALESTDCRLSAGVSTSPFGRVIDHVLPTPLSIIPYGPDNAAKTLPPCCRRRSLRPRRRPRFNRRVVDNVSVSDNGLAPNNAASTLPPRCRQRPRLSGRVVDNVSDNGLAPDNAATNLPPRCRQHRLRPRCRPRFSRRVVDNVSDNALGARQRFRRATTF